MTNKEQHSRVALEESADIVTMENIVVLRSGPLIMYAMPARSARTRAMAQLFVSTAPIRGTPDA